MGYIEDLREIIGHRPIILVGAVVAILQNDRLLLQRRKATPIGKWGLVGGLMELGESLEETAIREVREETGLHITNLHFITILSGPQYYVEVENGDTFYAVTVAYYTRDSKGSICVDERESSDLCFFAFNELPDTIVGSHLEILNDLKAIISA